MPVNLSLILEDQYFFGPGFQGFFFKRRSCFWAV
jgi:hypothetical protein